MRKKILSLGLSLVLVGGLITGCGSKDTEPKKSNDTETTVVSNSSDKKEEEIKPATYTELITATNEAYKDIKNGSFGVSVDSDLTLKDTTETTELKGSVVLDMSMDEDTIYAKMNLSGFDIDMEVSELELYFDTANNLMYGNAGDGWELSEDASMEDMLGGFGFTMEDTEVPEIDYESLDIEVETTKDGYAIKKTITGKELFDLLDNVEDAIAEEESIELFKPIFEKLLLTVEATYNTDKVLNDVKVSVKADKIDLGEGALLDGTLALNISIENVNKTEVSIPQEVIDTAKAEENGSGFEIDSADDVVEEYRVNGSQFDIK